MTCMVSKRGVLKGLGKSPHGEESYDSALEREYMVELERDPGVIRWTKKHGITIPYTLFGFPHRYFPDFMVECRDGSKELHETKGLPLMLWLSTKIKGQTAEEWCAERGWRYKMITKGAQAFYGRV